MHTLIRLLTPSSCDASNFILCDILRGGGTSPANCDLGSEDSASRTLPAINDDDDDNDDEMIIIITVITIILL